jgi:hypothetical protein
MEYHLGPIYSPEGAASVMNGRVVVVLFDSGLLPKSTAYIYWGGMFQRSRYLSILKKSKIFMNICETLLNKFYKEGRDILFVGERIKLLEELFKRIKSNDKGLFIGSAKLDMIENKVTFSTPNKCRDGIDLVSKNLVIMSSPIGNVEQMTGRVLRIQEGKLEPIIIDMVDINIHEISGTLNKRLDFYKTKNWDIKYILVSSDGNKREISSDELETILK